MDNSNEFDEQTLIDMMFENSSIDSFKSSLNKDKDSEKN